MIAPIKAIDDSIVDSYGHLVAITMGYDSETQSYSDQKAKLEASQIVMAVNNPPDIKIKNQRDKLKLYVDHDQKCLRRPYCTCGLDALLDEIGGKP
jgi:hypothetical protein